MFQIGGGHELRHAHRPGPGATQAVTRHALLQQKQGRHEFVAELFGHVAFESQRRQDSQYVAAARGRSEITFDPQYGDK